MPWLVALSAALVAALAGLSVALSMPLVALALLAGTFLRWLWIRKHNERDSNDDTSTTT